MSKEQVNDSIIVKKICDDFVSMNDFRINLLSDAEKESLVEHFNNIVNQADRDIIEFITVGFGNKIDNNTLRTLDECNSAIFWHKIKGSGFISIKSTVGHQDCTFFQKFSNLSLNDEFIYVTHIEKIENTSCEKQAIFTYDPQKIKNLEQEFKNG